MCGIIGFTGNINAAQVLVKGLSALEYRGYDSAGIAIGDSGAPDVIKSAGRISVLEEKLKEDAPRNAFRGIAHTRWATHGRVSDANSHPHFTDNVCLVHNGIIENYYKLQGELSKKGYKFLSETDTEAALALIDLKYREYHDPKKAIFEAVKQIEGSYAFGIIFSDIKEKIYAIRNQSPLIAACSEHGCFIASDVTPLLEYTKEFYRPDDGVLITLSRERIEFEDAGGHTVLPGVERVDWDVEEARKGGYPHFMLKEIHEIPEALKKTVSSFIREGLPFFGDAFHDQKIFSAPKKIHLVACGTAMHAGLIGKRLIEELARIPVNVEIASEFRYRKPILESDDIVILLSQSGETADTLASLRYAKGKNIPTLSIVNVFGSSIACESDYVLYTKAGPEIAVASTKAYAVQCALLALLALHMASEKKVITKDAVRKYIHLLTEELPEAVGSALDGESVLEDTAKKLTGAEHIFFIGRGIDADVCTEGSLKLKEISYIHSEAYPAGELKHGTISLIQDQTPVIACATDRALCEKMISGIREVKSRGAYVILLTTEELSEEYGFSYDKIITLKHSADLFTFIPAVSALQLLAYHVSAQKGLDVDKPRNLAKSVTVE